MTADASMKRERGTVLVLSKLQPFPDLKGLERELNVCTVIRQIHLPICGVCVAGYGVGEAGRCVNASPLHKHTHTHTT